MNHNNVAWVLRADGLFNLIAGLVLLTFYRPVVALVGEAAYCLPPRTGGPNRRVA
jgi:hypothetical protein